ncbi:PEP-CTERM sorting domain-containing protein [Bradyrhizobium guangdongense]
MEVICSKFDLKYNYWERNVWFKSFVVAAGIAALAVGSTDAFASEYLTNRSFETGDFSGWTLVGDQGLVFVVDGSAVPYIGGGVSQGAQHGSFYVYEGPIGSEATLSQSFADTSGATLTISGWVTGDGSQPSDVRFLFNGIELGAINPVPDQQWTQYVFSAIATGNDTFSVAFRNDNSFDGLDNFSVSSVSAVPEPGTWALLLLGFASLGALRYYRIRALAA